MSTTTNFSVSRLAKMRQFYAVNPTGIIKIDWLTKWTAYEFRQWFVSCLNAKINSKSKPVPTSPTRKFARKTSDDWQQQARYTQRLVNNRNVVRVTDVHPDLQPRLAHRITHSHEF